MDALVAVAFAAGFMIGALYGRWRSESGRARYEGRQAWLGRRRYRGTGAAWWWPF